MTERNNAKRRNFAREILGLASISALIAVVVFLVVTNIAATVAEVYVFEQDVPMTEFDWLDVHRWIFGVGGALAIAVFCVLFLAKLGERLAYIRKITAGIHTMRLGEVNAPIPLEGNNELTELADAINYMANARQILAEKEKALAREKDQLIRSLSHDIRTPLTAILAYSEYLAADACLSDQEQKRYLQMMKKKAEQIRDLTDILLDGSKRNPEHFEDGKLLMEQLAAEFEEELEAEFTVTTDLSRCSSFSGRFDVQELRRIFDNLSSNVRKYADSAHPVCLAIQKKPDGLLIRQFNAVRMQTEQPDSYQLGIHSIRRIAQHYGGTVTVEQTEEQFEISIQLSAIL